MKRAQGYERSDLDRRAALLLVVALGALLAVSAATSRAMLGRRAGEPSAATAEPPPPRLQPDPAAELQRIRARDRERLGTYGWIDREAGLVRIPIERAMEIVAREAAEDER